MTEFSLNDVLNAVSAASQNLSARKDEVNRLNVFPVPDGDTGTNMSLTLESVVRNLEGLPMGAPASDVRHAITTGALMGARGNSGVITSQILRGLCEGATDAFEITTDSLDVAFSKAQEVAFQAVRKPVEGTILTVLKDTAAAAKQCRKKKLETRETLEELVRAAYESVQRTPELLPVLKENNVVDAGGFGLAILVDGFVASLLGKSEFVADQFSFNPKAEPKVEIEHFNDWEGSEYRYCNEFLVHSETLDKDEALEFLSTMGDCELCVGATPKFKVHVHSNHPNKVLEYFLERGQIFEVFIHNMDLQSVERNEKLVAEQAQAESEHKEFGVVAVAAGEGNAKILKSLGVDVVVSGGQTMNPSTADLLDAVNATHADNVIILPNNSNIIMAANTASELAEVNCAVVPTKSVPQAFAAMFGYDAGASIDDNVEDMTDSFADVKTGEVTTAIKDSKDAKGEPIAAGDVIGIADGSIDAVGDTVEGVVMSLLAEMEADSADTCTLLAGEDFSDEALEALVAQIEAEYDDLEIDSHRGDQPLYPVILSVE
ncbi:MAG: DAK2 domain-containing protein [Eggerthellaceae bacterium]|nr:DAK2 domain-containing protein [Eggerthellaceae bacterium]